MSFTTDVRPDVTITDLDGDTLVQFKYAQPNISVSTGARYVTHEPFGDTVVRQKIGKSPDEISVDGDCTEREANAIDDLVRYDKVEFISKRWEGVVHVAGTSTQPFSDGGAIDKDREWIHGFSIELVETDDKDYSYMSYEV